jgi:hypothetical protein
VRFWFDLLGRLRDALLSAVIEDEDLVEDGRFVEKVWCATSPEPTDEYQPRPAVENIVLSRVREISPAR